MNEKDMAKVVIPS